MTVFLDSPVRVAEGFWLGVTGASLSRRRGAGGEFATLVPRDGDAYVRVQVVGDPPARSHLDLHVDDVRAVAGVAVSLGARVVRAEEGLIVLRSPAGLLFCLVGWRGEARLPAPVRWPGGQLSLVDQVSVDLPDAAYEVEVGFWEGLTGWSRRPTGLPEFEHFQRGPGMPLRLLFQRLGSGAARMHVDLACDDVDAEVVRHRALGAVVVRRVVGEWTTLRDPAGREYCVTARSPLR
ncbi:VOC family protein [Actinoplanes sp. TBRC 11911]|uniref:VOC family protein n=1 Tax=Actinoplanes sp. TBRC 11911 TaxID=2729386 RepID=UPI001B7D6C09|nr:VOC family protein [Actinoplanes sp. TBRC 11911]